MKNSIRIFSTILIVAACVASTVFFVRAQTLQEINLSGTGVIRNAGGISIGTTTINTGVLTLGSGGIKFIDNSVISSANSVVSTGSSPTLSSITVTNGASFGLPITIGSPTLGTHAATKSYVDSAASGGGFWGGTKNGNIWNGDAGAGNVGVGTVSPTAKLHVSAPISTTVDGLKMEDSTASGGYFKVTDGTSISGQYIPTFWSKGVGTGQTDRNGFMVVAEPGEDGTDDAGIVLNARLNGAALVNAPVLKVSNYATELMRVGANGNVGIGTTAPVAKLEVKGVTTSGGGTVQTLLVNGDTGNGALTINSNSTGNHAYQTYAQGGVAKFEHGIVPTTSDFYINPNTQVGSTNAAIYIKKADGNVGIGTVTPGYKLDVNGNMNLAASGYLRTGSGDTEIGASGTNLYFKTYTGSALTEKMRILANGNVGIGTASPTYLLDVNGTARFSQPVAVGTPTANEHATTKSYVDAAGGSSNGGGALVTYGTYSGTNYPSGGQNAPSCPSGYAEVYAGFGPTIVPQMNSDTCSASMQLANSSFYGSIYWNGSTYLANTCRVCAPQSSTPSQPVSSGAAVLYYATYDSNSYTYNTRASVDAMCATNLPSGLSGKVSEIHGLISYSASDEIRDMHTSDSDLDGVVKNWYTSQNPIYAYNRMWGGYTLIASTWQDFLDGNVAAQLYTTLMTSGYMQEYWYTNGYSSVPGSFYSSNYVGRANVTTDSVYGYTCSSCMGNSASAYVCIAKYN